MELDAKRKLESQIKAKTRERDNMYALAKQNLDDPKRAAEEINECDRRIRALEMELGNLPGQQDPKSLADTRGRMVARIAKFRELMQDRRNTPLARQVLRKALKQPLRCIPILRDGRKDYAIGRNSFLLSREPVASPRGFEPLLPP